MKFRRLEMQDGGKIRHELRDIKYIEYLWKMIFYVMFAKQGEKQSNVVFNKSILEVLRENSLILTSN